MLPSKLDSPVPSLEGHMVHDFQEELENQALCSFFSSDCTLLVKRNEHLDEICVKLCAFKIACLTFVAEYFLQREKKMTKLEVQSPEAACNGYEITPGLYFYHSKSSLL